MTRESTGSLACSYVAQTHEPALCSFAHFHMHSAQLLIQTALAQERPPFIKEDFHWPPHRNPTSDDKALAGYREHASRFLSSQQLADQMTRAEKHETDD